MAAPFFIIGTPRSGTTLVSVLLENHSQVYIDGDSVGISLAREFQHYRRRLSQNPTQSKEALLAKICKGSYKGRLERLIKYDDANKHSDLRSLLAASVNDFAAKAGKKIWGDKTPELIFHLPEILTLFPNARIIQIVRDGHANVASLSQRQYYPLKLAAQYWKEINGLGMAYESILGKSQYLMVRYEALLLKPEESIKKMCDFLEIPFEKSALNLANASSTSGEGAYVAKKIDSSKIESWKNKLSPAQILQVENICGDLLHELEYELNQLSDPSKAKSLSYRKQFWLRQRMQFQLLFKAKRTQMIDRRLIKSRVPLKVRLRNFMFGSVGHFFSEKFIRTFKSNYK